jgi:hypothetical protein
VFQFRPDPVYYCNEDPDLDSVSKNNADPDGYVSGPGSSADFAILKTSILTKKILNVVFPVHQAARILGNGVKNTLINKVHSTPLLTYSLYWEGENKGHHLVRNLSRVSELSQQKTALLL